MALSERTKRLLSGREDTEVEFKTRIEQSFNSTLVAFANGKGGICLFGVEDAKDENGRHIGRVVGIEISDKTRGQIESRASETHDPILIQIEDECDDDGKGIYIVTIPEGMNKPYCTGGGRYLIRRDGQNCPITPTMMRSFFRGERDEPFLQIKWFDGRGEELPELTLPLARAKPRDEVLRHLHEVRPSDAEIELVVRNGKRLFPTKGGGHTIGGGIAADLGLGEPLDVVKVVKDFRVRIDKLIELVETNYDKFVLRTTIFDSTIEPTIGIINEGTIPADNIEITIFRTDRVFFLYKFHVEKLRLKLPSSRPMQVAKIIKACKQDRLWSIETSKHGVGLELLTPYFPQVSLPSLPYDSKAHGRSVIPLVPNPIQCSIIKGNATVHVSGKLMHKKFHKIFLKGIHVLSKAAAGERSDVPFVCHAYNLRRPIEGALHIMRGSETND